MADHFFDTSAAAKHYRAEVGTAKVDALLAETGSRHLLSALSLVEVHSIFARLVRTGQITDADLHLARGRFLADIAVGLWQVVQLTADHFQQAQQLLVQHGTARSLRTLDALQLAVALHLQGAGALDDFVCADTNLCQVAAGEGLAVIDPELP
jgi:predicted nucleic acid-binding protein